jgi:hypothetical protein
VSSISTTIKAIEDDSLEESSIEAPLADSESPESSLTKSDELVLADLAQSAQAERPEKPLTESEELVLADRTEFGLRLFVDCEEKVPAVKEALKPCLDVAVEFLVEKGNPLSQVKMMRACQRILDLDLHSVIEKPLRSPIKWVRDQALLLVALAQSQTRIGKANLATEIGFDLASNEFLRRWPIYAKAAVRMKDTGIWWCFALATILSLAQLPLITVLGILAFSRGFAPQEVQPILVTTLIAAILTLYGVPNLAWLLVPGAAWLSRGLSFIGSALWLGVPIELITKKFSDDSLPEFLLFIAISGIAVSVLHTLALLGYLALTRGPRGKGYKLSSFLRYGWRECAYWLPYMVAATWALMLVFPSPKPNEPPIPKPHDDGNLYGVFPIALLVWMNVIIFLARGGAQEGTWRERLHHFTWEAVSWIKVVWEESRVRGALLATCFLLLPPALLYIVGVKLIVHLPEIYRVYQAHSLLFARILIASILAVIIAIVVLNGVLLLRLMAAGRRMFPPNSFSPEEWKARIRRAGRWKQRELLRRTNHQSLGLGPKDYLEVLREVRASFEQEPAASLYWNLRDQLEQAIKQERQG